MSSDLPISLGYTRRERHSPAYACFVTAIMTPLAMGATGFIAFFIYGFTTALLGAFGWPRNILVVLLESLPALGFFIWVSLIFMTATYSSVRWERVQSGLRFCPHCEYCLEGNASGRCPECGRKYSR